MPETIGQQHYGVIRIHICCTKESMHTSVNLRNWKNGSVSMLRLFRYHLFGSRSINVWNGISKVVRARLTARAGQLN